MKIIRLTGRGIVMMGFMPLWTYWFVAKRLWVHTLAEKLLLLGLFVCSVLLFLASNMRISAGEQREYD